MKILVDTCVWSIAFRRRSQQEDSYALMLKEIILEDRAYIIGPIRQELLSGISSKKEFNSLKSHLDSFPDLEISSTDYCRAAEMFNLIRSNGIQGSPTDLLICTIAEKFDMLIFTLDNDFGYYAKYLPIKLYKFND